MRMTAEAQMQAGGRDQLVVALELARDAYLDMVSHLNLEALSPTGNPVRDPELVPAMERSADAQEKAHDLLLARFYGASA